jgi:error-prone DNA polymerase
MVTAGRLRVLREEGASRGEPQCSFSTLAKCADDVIALSGCRNGEVRAAVERGDIPAARRAVRRDQEIFGRDHFFLELCVEESEEKERLVLARLADLAQELGAPLVATANVHYLTPDQAEVREVLTCIQTLTTREEWHPLRRHGAARYLKSPQEMKHSFRSYPEAIANTVRIAEQCEVDLGLGELHLPHFRMRDYRPEGVPEWWPAREEEVAGEKAARLLEWLCRAGIPRPVLTGTGVPALQARLRHELTIIRDLGLCEYFLVVWDIVAEARARGIRCSGRGSAADSLVSYLLGITDVDPIASRLLFERFLNPERRGLPDIDIDFDSRRRDEMLEYVAERYGVEHTGMVATINTYHARSAIREVGKALSVPEDLIDRISKSLPYVQADRIRQAIATLPELRGSGFNSAALEELFGLCEAVAGMPRHLSVHLGGVVISRDPITDVTPLEVSSKGAVVCQFDKDDVEALGLVKMDLLGLRILSAIEESLQMIRASSREPPNIDHLPLDDEQTFALLRATRTVGVFQLESPGMRGLLASLQPTHFEDIIANISLFRPGPMQADMITPFLARQHGKEQVTYLHPDVIPALESTYGVILYQEQVLEVASALAGFTLGQADSLRRMMTKGRSETEMAQLKTAFLEGCRNREVPEEIAEEAFRRLSAFAAYGFCKAHAAQFAIIAYQTAYLKAHYPAEFLAAILSNQPMGFYPPEVIVQEAKHCGVEVRPVDINHSRSRYWVEEGAIRVGLAQVIGVSGAALEAIFAARAQRPFRSLRDFCARTGIARPMVDNLIRAGAFDAFGPRRELRWELSELCITGARRTDRVRHRVGQTFSLPLAAGLPPNNPADIPALQAMTEREETRAELATTGLSVTRHPLYFARARLKALGVVSRRQLDALPDGRWVKVAGVVISRQRPPTKSGAVVVFITAEDETGLLDITVFDRVYQQYGKAIFSHPALVVAGRLQKKGRYGTVVVAERVEGLKV